MLIYNDTELSQFLPSSVIEDVEKIAMLIDRAEDAHLRPVIGDELYNHICELHERNGAESEYDTKETKLITLCQSAAIYFALADNVGILSISYNTGGGFSIVSTGDYTPADKEEKDRLERDLWKNAWRDIDRILDILELDAKSENPKYKAMWEKSEWFYHQGDLLITTAKEAKRYLKREEMQNFGRKHFVEMLGDLRFCQMSFISQAIGEDFLAWLVAYDYTASQPDTDNNIVNDKVVKQTKEYLSMALMAAMRYRNDHRGADENDANLALFRAIEYIKSHQSDFGHVMETSPLYVRPAEDSETKTECAKNNKRNCDCFGDGDALFAPFL